MIRHSRLARILSVILIAAALTLTGAVPSFAAEGYEDVPSLDGTSAILMDAGSGEILYEKNAYEVRDPASITKILNCMVVLDTLDMDEEVTIDIEPETEGSVMKLQKGEKIKVKDLVYAMMLWSANDAAEVLGYLAGGDMETFCGMMNERAELCGAKDTKYTNPNGLNDEAVNNVTTAYDIAVITRSAMKNPQFRKIVATSKYKIPATNKSKAREHKSSDRCLWDTKTKVNIDGKQTPLKYDGCIGVKTGYSSTAGDCYAGCVKRGSTELISVVLNASHEEQKFQDSINLWNYGFENYKTYTVARMNDVQCRQKVKYGELSEVDLGVAHDMKITVSRSAKPAETVTTKIELNEEKVEAPVKNGTVLGQIIAYNDGKEVARQDLIALEDSGRGGPLSHIGIADEEIPILVLVLATGIVIIIIIRILAAKKMRRDRRRRRARSRRTVRHHEWEREHSPFEIDEKKIGRMDAIGHMTYQGGRDKKEKDE